MKNEYDKNKGIKESSVSQPQAACVEIDWFRQFDDRPGLESLYTPAELETMKIDMFAGFKKKINELD